MYIEPVTSGYESDGTQVSRRGLFLLLLTSENSGSGQGAVRAIVRKVALRQCGHWMMGSAQIKGHRISVSGSYGSDGLTCTVPNEVYLEGFPLPDELWNAWNKGEGWNGAGSEAPAMRDWAIENLDKLYRVRG